MMLRFLFDAGVGRIAERTLREMGCDVLSVLDVDPSMADSEVLALASREGRVLVTMDTDFGQLAFEGGLKHSGVVLLRVDRAVGHEKARILHAIVTEQGSNLTRGFFVYSKDKLRHRVA